MKRFWSGLAVPLLAAGLWMTTAGGVLAASTNIRVTTIARALEVPWAIAFLPDGRMLVTERPGRIRIVTQDGRVSPPLRGVPEVQVGGQGGLLDIALSPDFASDRLVFMSFSQATQRGARTAVARAVIDPEALTLSDVRVIFAQRDEPSGNAHFGSRLAFAPDGTLFVTLGERYKYRDKAQALDSHLGKIVRITADGDVPPDNPFVDTPQALNEIWSFGHRNVQGAAIHPRTGQLWAHEHGPQGGDEVNIPARAGNHGWPEITYGREYVTGFSIGEGTTRDDVVAPLHQWTPSIAPSGMSFYTGDLFPAWRDSLFVGSLKFGFLVRLTLDGDRVVDEERLLDGVTRRIRDVREGPDGALYVLDEYGGRILRLTPH